eukprot:1159497-Pelagomonas_calceolata.AAC.3
MPPFPTRAHPCSTLVAAAQRNVAVKMQQVFLEALQAVQGRVMAQLRGSQVLCCLAGGCENAESLWKLLRAVQGCVMAQLRNSRILCCLAGGCEDAASFSAAPQAVQGSGMAELREPVSGGKGAVSLSFLQTQKSGRNMESGLGQ